MKDQQKAMGPMDLKRELSGEIQEATGGEDSRRFTISFSSETPYERWFGPEVLDHSDGAIDMSRLQEIGVVLYNHNRDDVIGKINKAWTEEHRGMVEIEFDKDDFSEKIYQKVRSGTLKGVSVGYKVTNFEEVGEGRKSSDMRFDGPCYVARSWMPYEVSIVSVPADPTVGVGRSDEERTEPDVIPDLYETMRRQYQYNLNGGK